jgi:hypothetical protein
MISGQAVHRRMQLHGNREESLQQSVMQFLSDTFTFRVLRFRKRT